MPDAGPDQLLRHGPCRRSGGEASRALSSRSIPPVTSIRCHRTRTRMSRIITIIVTDTTSARLRARRWNIPRPHSAQADNLRLCVARRPHRHGPFEAPSLTSDLGVRWRALSIIVRSPIFMNRILAAMLAAASCATMAQAQVGPSAPVAQDAPVYTLDQAVSAAGGSAPAAEAATAGIDAARAGRTVAGLRPNPVVQGQVENVIGSGPYRGSAARKPRSALRSRSS